MVSVSYPHTHTPSNIPTPPFTAAVLNFGSPFPSIFFPPLPHHTSHLHPPRPHFSYGTLLLFLLLLHTCSMCCTSLLCSLFFPPMVYCVSQHSLSHTSFSLSSFLCAIFFHLPFVSYFITFLLCLYFSLYLSLPPSLPLPLSLSPSLSFSLSLFLSLSLFRSLPTSSPFLFPTSSSRSFNFLKLCK